MCGITVAIKLAGRSAYCKTNAAAGTNGRAANNHAKKRKLSDGLVSDSDSHAHANANLHCQLASSLDAINHRGPDSHGTWISPDGNIGTRSH